MTYDIGAGESLKSKKSGTEEERQKNDLINEIVELAIPISKNSPLAVEKAREKRRENRRQELSGFSLKDLRGKLEDLKR